MKSDALAALAASSLGSTCWLWTVLAEPGTNYPAALGAGLASYVTVRLTLAAASARFREDMEAEVRRADR